MRNGTQRATILTLGGLLLATTGCLIQETTHTLYLDPDGGLRWMVVQQEIRSDDKDPARRAAEERSLLDAARVGMHDVANALHHLGATDVRSQVLRESRPYMVWTEARFGSVADVAQNLVDELGLSGKAALDFDGKQARLSIVVHPDDGGEPDEGSPVGALLEESDRYRFVLTSGEFVAGAGFRILEEGRAALFAPAEDASEQHDNVVVLSLTWTLD